MRKVAKRILPGSAETESYSRKTKVFTFDGVDAGCTPGGVGRSTRQIRGGPSALGVATGRPQNPRRGWLKGADPS